MDISRLRLVEYSWRGGGARGRIPKAIFVAPNMRNLLRHDKNGGAWCPKNTVTKETYEHLEIDLGRLTVVTGTRTQGRFGNGQGQEFAEEFFLDYWRPGFTRWRRWRNRQGKQKVFDVEHVLNPVVPYI
ncbi:unnamed protein product [Nezara viridula]|uniref:F5/8 type C domain-containing protein n=1 Tax=Nezara viridula TaxID=85310 RepID=A0A9P0H4P2_NEZVI|nr:unnamed protein product [Nezara viridula]